MNAATIREAEEDLRLAMLRSDADALNRLLSDDLVFTTFLGTVISKEDDVEAHRSGLLQMHRVELTDQRVRIEGELAIVTCEARIDATFSGARADQRLRFTRVWRSEAGIPRVLAGQATLIGD